MTQEQDSKTELENSLLEAPQSVLNRRQFIGAGIATAATFILPKPVQAMMHEKSTSVPTNLTAQNCPNTITIPSGTPFQNPPIAVPASQDVFIINTQLSQAQAQAQAKIPGLTDPISVRTYNCQIPGSTFYLNPGGKLSITLKNLFPENASGTCPVDLSSTNYPPNCFYTTNLHFHGLHVSPKQTSLGVASDDVLVSVAPGESQKYCVQLPEYHAPGTHWYHAHLHGSTGVQVSNGLAGAIIIKEPKKNQIVPEERDKVWLIQEVIDSTDPLQVYIGASRAISATYLVNGIYQPTITVNKAEFQRWRFINAGATPRSLMNIKLVKSLKGIYSGGTSPCTFPPCDRNQDVCTVDSNNIIPMWLIAVDGISFYGKKPQSTKGWDMAPGNRADFLFWLPKDTEDNATYYLIKDIYIFPDRKTATKKSVQATQRSVQILATVQVTTSKENGNDPEPPNFEIPGKENLPDYLKPIEYREIFGNDGKSEPIVQDVRFSIPYNPGNSPTGFGVYEVNEAQYGVPENLPAITATLNKAEIWTLRNLKIATGGSPHPFHIHVNPFQLVGDKIDPEGPNDSSNWRWWDTIAVNPESCVPIVQRFTDYDGEYVLHCHILIHEDLGMMRNVKIKDDGTGKPPCKKVWTSTFKPSSQPTYLKLEDICNHLPTPEPVKGATSNPTCKDAGSVCNSSQSVNQVQSQAPNPGSGKGGGRVPGSGKGRGQKA